MISFFFALIDEQSYIRDIIDNSFKYSGEVPEIHETDFIQLFEGRLGPASTVKTVFRLFGGKSAGSLSAKEFFTSISKLEHGTTQEQLQCEYFTCKGISVLNIRS